MQVGIDISQIVYETGVSVYTKELVRNLVALQNGTEYKFFAGTLRQKKAMLDFAKSIRSEEALKFFPIPPTLADFLWNSLHVLPITRFIGKVDVFHTSDWSEPPTNCPKVTTLHDLSPLIHPEHTDEHIVEVHKRKLYWVIKESDRVIVPSNATKLDAIKLGLAEKKIRVIFEAPSDIYVKQDKKTVDALKRKYRISGKYALVIGASKRKNIGRIIKAFEKAKPDTKLTNLLIVGRGLSNNIDPGVKYLGHVSTAELPILYSGASLLIYPSLYEGFGLPILEAFRCGCPVLTSNISSMAEIAGNAAITVNPFSVESIADGIVKTLKSSNLLVKKGLKHAERFTWQKAAQMTHEVYEELV